MGQVSRMTNKIENLKKMCGAKIRNNNIENTLFFRVGSAEHHMGKLNLPVYLNSTRAELLFTVDLAV